jgi:serine/threonine-protein kinase HipA
LIKRFDRRIVADASNPEAISRIDRLHVIDACQALDLPASFKYERNLGSNRDVRDIREGVSFERLFSLSGLMETPVTAKQFLIRWAILHLLLGNSDAHGKNISFHVGPHGLAPTPMYDLVSVHAYGDRFDNDMAMAYGDVFRLEELTPYALADFAHRTSTAPAWLARELKRMSELALRNVQQLAGSSIYLDEERAVVSKIAEFVQAQASLLLKLAPEVPKIDPNLFGDPPAKEALAQPGGQRLPRIS